MFNTFIALTDKDKRVILIFFLLLIVLVAFIAVIGELLPVSCVGKVREWMS